MKIFKTALALALSMSLLLQIVPLQASASSTVQASSTISDTLYTPNKVSSELEYTYADYLLYLEEYVKSYSDEWSQKTCCCGIVVGWYEVVVAATADLILLTYFCIKIPCGFGAAGDFLCLFLHKSKITAVYVDKICTNLLEFN